MIIEKVKLIAEKHRIKDFKASFWWQDKFSLHNKINFKLICKEIINVKEINCEE